MIRKLCFVHLHCHGLVFCCANAFFVLVIVEKYRLVSLLYTVNCELAKLEMAETRLVYLRTSMLRELENDCFARKQLFLDTYVCMYLETHIYKNISLYLNAYRYVYMYVCAHRKKYIYYIHNNKCTYVYITCVEMNMHACVHCMHA